jgi:hypothetical protein
MDKTRGESREKSDWVLRKSFEGELVQFCLNNSKTVISPVVFLVIPAFMARGKIESIPTQPETFSPFTWLLIYGIDNF